jgi:hypothetical protein
MNSYLQIVEMVEMVLSREKVLSRIIANEHL